MTDIGRDALDAVFTESGTRPVPLTQKRKIMGGSATITLIGGGPMVMQECWNLGETLERLWSRFRDDSDVTRLNWSEGIPTAVDPLTVLLIEEMRAGFARTSGDFDPTLLPDVLKAGYNASLVDASKKTTLPESAQSPGHPERIRVSGNEVTLPRGTTLDPGGIGKGLAADLVAGHALSLGAWGAMIEIAGDIRVVGESPDGTAWRLGVENPFDVEEGGTNGGEHIAIVRVGDAGVVTSSQRKKRFGENRERHHLIDARTHGSASTTVQTVTVISMTAAKAETLTKSGFVRPVPDFLDWLPTVGSAGMVITSDGTRAESVNWSDYQ